MTTKQSKACNVAFVGAAGSGKTTLAQGLVLPLKLMDLDAVFVPEPVRIFLRRSGPYSHYLEDFPIFLETVQQEEEMQEHQCLVYDSASFVSAAYMQFYRPEELSEAEEQKWEYCYRLLYGLARDRRKRFQQIFYVPSGKFPLQEDPNRRWKAEEAETLDILIKAFLDSNSIPYHQVESVDLNDRLQEVCEVLVEQGHISAMPPLRPDS